MAEIRDMTFQQGARELRKHLDQSQQSMATFLGLSMGALRNYETPDAVTTPDARAATAYLLAAEMSGRLDLVEVFRSALHQAMGIEEPSSRKRIEEVAEGSGDQKTDLDPLQILAQMTQLRQLQTHPMAKTLF